MNAIANVKAQLRLKQWAQQVDECQKSGLSVSAWCKANGIRTNTYYYRLRQVREYTLDNIEVPSDYQSVRDETDISFKHLQVQSPLKGMQAAVIVHLPNATLEVSSSAERSTLEAVLLALKSVC